MSPASIIQDRQSFDAIAGEGHEIAGLYFYCILDHLVDIAWAVSRDFSVGRFHLFTDNTADSAQDLLRLYTQLGSNEIFLSREHRQMIWRSLFGHGASDQESESHSFPQLRSSLLEAASEYVTRAEIETGAPGLISGFRLALIPFNQFILSAQGAAVRLYRLRTFPALTEDNVYRILRNPGVAAVYGINAAIADQWPYAFDTNANKMIAEISRQLQVTHDSGEHYSQKWESYLETTAKRGAVAIATAIDTGADSSSDESIVDLINKCYAWHTALKFVGHNHTPSPAREVSTGEARQKLSPSRSSLVTSRR
jgi:hypothetical protein